MKIAISAPSGFNAREILLPLQNLLEADSHVEHVFVITPVANQASQVFINLSDKFSFHTELPGEADVVITPTFGLDGNDVPILKKAKAEKIPSIVFVASWDNVFKMQRFLERDLEHAIPDFFAVWNEMNKKHLEEILPEFSGEKITITGPPRFDCFSHKEKIPSKNELLDYLGFPQNDLPLIHGATTELYPFDYIWETIKQSGIKANLYASVHPGGDMSKHDYKKFGVKSRYSFGRREKAVHPNFKYAPTQEEIYMLVALFKHADVLVNQSSTVAIESAAAGTPIINVKFGKTLDWWNWYRSMVYRDFKEHYRYITDQDGTAIVTNKNQLSGALRDYLKNPQDDAAGRERVAKKLLTFTDGNNGQRLLDLVKQCAAS